VVVIGDLCALALFSILVACGFLARRQPAVHARCMVLAGLLLMGPALTTNRWLGAWLESLSPLFGLPLALVVFFAAMAAYDVIARRRLHWVTLAGAVAILSTLFIAEPIAETPMGRAFVFSLAAPD